MLNLDAALSHAPNKEGAEEVNEVDIPQRVARWLRTSAACELLDELSEALPAHAQPGSASGTQLALAVRVAQLRLRGERALPP